MYLRRVEGWLVMVKGKSASAWYYVLIMLWGMDWMLVDWKCSASYLLATLHIPVIHIQIHTFGWRVKDESESAAMLSVTRLGLCWDWE